jgi:pimeloyl-ACP methyl ester carboxylesterase
VAERKAEVLRSPNPDDRGREQPVVAAVSQAAKSGRIVRFRSQDGLLLAVRIFDASRSNRLPLLCLPGLSRNSRDFTALGNYFAGHPTEARTVIAVDYRGRGLSDPDRRWQNYAPSVEAEDVLGAATALGIEQAVLVGTSRGGILAMILGALRPGLIAGVVLNDIGAVLEGTGLARIKRHLDGTRPVSTWDEAISLVRNNGSSQFPGLSLEDWRATTEAYFAQNRAGLAPQFDRRLLRAIADIDFSAKIPDLWPQFASLQRVPVLAIRGELSDVLSAETLAEMADRHPDLESLTVRGQGHAPLLRDAPTLARILGFVRRCGAARTS